MNSRPDLNQDLFIASSTGCLEKVRTLVREGAQVNGRHCMHGTKATALHEAALVGNLPIVQYLFSQGGKVNERDSEGRTPLHIAAYYGHMEIVRYLVEEAGADTGMWDRWGESACDYASKCNRREVAEFLMKY